MDSHETETPPETSGSGLFDGGKEMTDEEITRLFDSPAPEAAPSATPESDANNSFPDFSLFDAPRKPGKKALGPDDKEELAEFFTQDGIGGIVARGFDAFFVTCGAEPMTQKESNNMAKVVAYYFRARLPKEAGAYQPELLLAATIGFAVFPRLGPITEKTGPFWRRAWDKLKSVFRRGE